MGLGQVLAGGAVPLVEVGNGIEPEAVEAELEPEPHHLEHGVGHLGVVVVEVGLVRVEAVPVVLIAERLVGPVGLLHVDEHHPGLGPALVVVVPHVPVGFGVVPALAGLDEPWMVRAGVVDDQVGDDPDAPGVGLVEQHGEVLDGPRLGMDREVVADVVAAVPKRRRVEGQQPDAVDAQPFEIVELGDEPRDVAHPVVVAVEEPADEHLVEDGPLEPEGVLGRIGQGQSPGGDVMGQPFEGGHPPDPGRGLLGGHGANATGGHDISFGIRHLCHDSRRQPSRRRGQLGEHAVGGLVGVEVTGGQGGHDGRGPVRPGDLHDPRLDPGGQDLAELALEPAASHGLQLAAVDQVAPVFADGLPQLFGPLAGRGHRLDDGRPPVGGCRELEHELEVALRLPSPRPVGLVDHEQVGDLEQPGLVGLDGVTPAGVHHHHRGVGGRRHRHLLLPDPDRLDEHDREAHRRQHAEGVGDGERQAAEVAPGGHRADEHPFVERVALHAHPVAEDGPARERRGRVDGEHGHRPRPVQASLPGDADEPVGEGRLAGPGEPVMPTV